MEWGKLISILVVTATYPFQIAGAVIMKNNLAHLKAIVKSDWIRKMLERFKHTYARARPVQYRISCKIILENKSLPDMRFLRPCKSTYSPITVNDARCVYRI